MISQLVDKAFLCFSLHRIMNTDSTSRASLSVLALVSTDVFGSSVIFLCDLFLTSRSLLYLEFISMFVHIIREN